MVNSPQLTGNYPAEVDVQQDINWHDVNSRHLGNKPGAVTISQPHSQDIPLVDILSRYPATRDNEFQFIAVRAIPGTSASKVYICLGNNANPTTYSWVQWATG